MLSRRSLLSGLALASFAGPLAAQGKKSSGNSTPAESMEKLYSIAGKYRSQGLNTDGSSYQGVVDVVQQGQAVEFTWVVGKETMRGSGLIEGRVVTIDWGDTTPVIYVVMENGELHGTWADGLALEKMTPR